MMRQLGGGPTLAEAQQGWAGLEQARRQRAMSNFSRANDSVVALTRAPSDEARSSMTTTTIVVSTQVSLACRRRIHTHTQVPHPQTLEIVGIIGALLALILVAFAVKGVLDVLFA